MHPQNDSSISRFIGLDLHKHYVVVAAVNAQQEVVLRPRKISLDDLPAWAEVHLGSADALVLEATGNAWYVYDLLAPHVGRCIVANPLQVKWIAAAAVKTDPHDAVRLAKLLAANLVPAVWVPPQAVRELRALISHRRQLVKQQTRLTPVLADGARENQLHSVLHRHYILLPEGDPFAAHNRAWWRQLELSPSERLRLQQALETLTHVKKQLDDVTAELHALSTREPWQGQATFLVQLPGFGVLTAMTVLSAIGDITRFERARQLVGYAGLGAGVHDSGQSHRNKSITKQGRRELRHVLVEAAWVAVQKSPYWKEQFRRLCRRKHSNVAIIAIARKLLVAVWHVLTERVADRNAVPEMVAFKLMHWSWKLSNEERDGLTSRQFIRYHLMRLKLGDDLTLLKYGNMPRRIASVEELLALKPELRLTA